MLRFTTGGLLWLVAIVGVSLAWWLSRFQLMTFLYAPLVATLLAVQVLRVDRLTSGTRLVVALVVFVVALFPLLGLAALGIAIGWY